MKYCRSERKSYHDNVVVDIWICTTAVGRGKEAKREGYKNTHFFYFAKKVAIIKDDKIVLIRPPPPPAVLSGHLYNLIFFSSLFRRIFNRPVAGVLRHLFRVDRINRRSQHVGRVVFTFAVDRSRLGAHGQRRHSSLFARYRKCHDGG